MVKITALVVIIVPLLAACAAAPTPATVLSTVAAAPSNTSATPSIATPTRLPQQTSTSVSPDGRWRAVATFDPPAAGSDKYHVRFEIMSVDGKTNWTVVDEIRTFGAGYTTPEVLRWSQDGQALYYTNHPHPDGCDVFSNGQDLSRVDLQTGRIREIVPKSGHVISLSPDEKTVAIIADGLPLMLVIHDVASGAERKVVLDSQEQDIQAGSIVWSPDTQALALTLAVHPCEPDHWLHSIVRVDLASLAVKTLIRDSSRYLRTRTWGMPTTIEIENGKDNLVLMDAETGSSPTR